MAGGKEEVWGGRGTWNWHLKQLELGSRVWFVNPQIEQEPARYLSVFSEKSRLQKAMVHVGQSEEKVIQGTEREDEVCA